MPTARALWHQAGIDIMQLGAARRVTDLGRGLEAWIGLILHTAGGQTPTSTHVHSKMGGDCGHIGNIVTIGCRTSP